jgi:hypothetical protein
MKSSTKQILIIISICIGINAIFSSLSNKNNEPEISNIGKSSSSTDDDQYLFGAPENPSNIETSQNQINNGGSIQSPDKPISTLDQIFNDIDDHAMNSGSLSEDQRTLYALCMQGNTDACKQFIAYSKQISNNYEMVGQMFDER